MNLEMDSQSYLGSILVLALAAGPACGDPVQDKAIAALGPESDDVERGPLHRPGQPCLDCHDGSHDSANFSVAGTLFRDPEHALPVANVDVELIDSAQRTFTTQSNCAGNFFVTPDDFAPHFPLWVTLRRGDAPPNDMGSPMHKNGNCNACHSDPPSPSSAGIVWVEFDPTTAATIPVGCN